MHDILHATFWENHIDYTLVYWFNTCKASVYLYTHILHTLCAHLCPRERARQRASFALVHWTVHPHMSNQTVVHLLCCVYTHSWIGKTCLTHDSTPDTSQCHCVGLVVPQHLERPQSLPAVSRTHIEGILFTRLGKDQSSRTLIATMCNFPPFCLTSYSFSF